MKRNYLKKIGSILLAGMLLVASGCSFGRQSSSSDSDSKYTVTFVQEGFKNIGIEVEKGGSLSDLPAPKAIEGYTVTWDKTKIENVTEDVTVTAVATPNNYLVTYRVSAENGETLEDASAQTVTYDAAYQLATPDRYGYSFMGWSDGSHVLTQSGIWKTPHNVTLTPTWADNSYKITFLHTDGSVETRTVEYGDVLSQADVPALSPEDGYDVSWSVTDFSSVNGNTTVNVVKKGKTYTVSYNLAADETLEGEATDSFVFASSYELKIPVKAGYTFRFWKLSDGTVLPQVGTWSLTKNVVLTAEWSQNDNLITFVHIDGSVEERTVKTGESLSASQIPFPKQEEGYMVSWDVKDFSSVMGAMTVTAVKNPITCKVSYIIPSDATIDGDKEQSIVFASQYELKTPSRYGYSFVGWKTEDGKLLPQTGTWSIPKDAVLTAVWEDNFCIVTFVQADKSTITYQIEKGDSLETLPVCKQTAGYTTTWDLTGIDLSNVTVSVTINAKKEANKYTINYSLVLGESLPAGVEKTFQVTYGQPYTLATPTHSDNALTFEYWLNNSTKKRVAISGTWNIAGDVKLVAVWDDKGGWTNFY